MNKLIKRDRAILEFLTFKYGKDTIEYTIKEIQNKNNKANNGKYIASGVAKPCKGSFYYSLMQSKGKKNCKYTLAYKKTSSGKYTTLTSGKTFSKNGVYTSPKKICRANGKTNYNFKMTKTAGKGTTSKVKVDWLIK